MPCTSSPCFRNAGLHPLAQNPALKLRKALTALQM